ncbi:MAG TPA: protein phosphatase 2C domain-containing protein [Blastocatellia bacterium]|nr:protein phosphatase 2C domain-containing protein [Blastocatellia bacterium]
MEIKVGVVCDRGLNPKRPVNQDRYLALADKGLFAVFDGVGGQRAGEVASQTASETVEEALSNSISLPPSDLIRRALEFANRDIFEMAESDVAYRTMATTAALVHINGNSATVAHVGDSRVYRLEGGRFYRETIDHTDFFDDLRGNNGPATGGRNFETNIINRALGVDREVDVEVKSIPLTEGARFLLCSDGIYRHIADEELAEVLSDNGDPQIAADELKRLVFERGADDNLTAVVVQVGRASQRKTGSSYSSNRAEPGFSPGDRNNRIEVPFARRAEGGGHGPGSSRKLVYLLCALVLLAGAFYAGLRASEWGVGGRNQVNESQASDPFNIALEDFNKGRYREAADAFASMAAREPANNAAWYWLGRSELELGEFEKAGPTLERAAASFPDANLYAAAAFRGAGKKNKAEALIEQYNERLRRGATSAEPR